MCNSVSHTKVEMLIVEIYREEYNSEVADWCLLCRYWDVLVLKMLYSKGITAG